MPIKDSSFALPSIIFTYNGFPKRQVFGIVFRFACSRRIRRLLGRRIVIVFVVVFAVIVFVLARRA
jgi:hypothetical protein